jgi:hypothetical protein
MTCSGPRTAAVLHLQPSERALVASGSFRTRTHVLAIFFRRRPAREAVRGCLITGGLCLLVSPSSQKPWLTAVARGAASAVALVAGAVATAVVAATAVVVATAGAAGAAGAASPMRRSGCLAPSWAVWCSR